MPPDFAGAIDSLLGQLRAGSPDAQEKLALIVYDELRRLAGALVRGERPGHTLQPTALVHEAWLKLLDQNALGDVVDRTHLVNLMARTMRCVLADHRRRRHSQKRGDGRQRVPLDEVDDHVAARFDQPLDELNELLEQLEQLHPRQSQAITLCYWFRHTNPEIAELLNVSLSTVEHDLRMARAWLRTQLGKEA